MGDLDNIALLTSQHRVLINMIFSYAVGKGTWPKKASIKARLEKENGGDLDEVLNSMPPGIVIPDYSIPEHVLKLSIIGVAGCSGSSRIIEAFLALHRLGAKRFIECPNGTPQVSGTDVAALLGTSVSKIGLPILEVIRDGFYPKSGYHNDSQQGMVVNLSESVISYEKIMTLKEWEFLKARIPRQMETISDDHLHILKLVYKSWSEKNEWPDRRQFLVEHRNLNDVSLLVWELSTYRFLEEREYQLMEKQQFRLCLTFQGICASGLAEKYLNLFVKCIGVFHKLYLEKEDTVNVNAEEVAKTLQAPFSDIQRVGYILSIEHPGVGVNWTISPWTATTTEYISEFKDINTIEQYFKKKFPSVNQAWEEIVKRADPYKKNEEDKQEIYPRKLLAIMITDVEGFTKMTEQNDEQTAIIMEEHKTFLSLHIQTYDGKIYKDTGDGYIVHFESIVSAVKCAVNLQQELAKKNQACDESERVRIRIGIDYGDIVIAPNDIYGNALNIAERIKALVEPERICITKRTYDEVKNNVKCNELGPRDVKNISEPVDCYEVIPDESPQTSELSELSASEVEEIISNLQSSRPRRIQMAFDKILATPEIPVQIQQCLHMIILDENRADDHRAKCLEILTRIKYWQCHNELIHEWEKCTHGKNDSLSARLATYFSDPDNETGFQFYLTWFATIGKERITDTGILYHMLNVFYIKLKKEHDLSPEQENLMEEVVTFVKNRDSAQAIQEESRNILEYLK